MRFLFFGSIYRHFHNSDDKILIWSRILLGSLTILIRKLLTPVMDSDSCLKKLCPSRDSNHDCSDGMQSNDHLRHHHCPLTFILSIVSISSASCLVAASPSLWRWCYGRWEHFGWFISRFWLWAATGAQLIFQRKKRQTDRQTDKW